MHHDRTLAPNKRVRDASAEIVLVLLVGATIYGWIAAYDTSTIAFQDSIEYLRMADFYRHFLFGQPLTEAADYYRTTRLPPLFPLLLAAFGAGSEHQHAAAVVTAATSVVAALAVYGWRRVEQPHGREGVGLALALLLLPAFFLFNLGPVSEPLAIALLCAAFALLAVPRPTPSGLIAAGLLIGLAPLARTALLPLPVAFSIWLLLQRPRPGRRAMLPIACAWLPILAWMAYRRGSGADNYLAYLGTARLTEVLGPWPDVLWLQPRRLFDAWVDIWGMPASAGITAASILIGVFAVAGSVHRLRQNRLDAWFLGGYILLILAWPFPFELTRFLVVVYPIILVCALDGLRLAAALRPSWRRLPGVALAAAVVLASVPAWMRYVSRAALPVDPELLGDKREPPFFRIRDEQRALVALEVFARMRLLSEEAGRYVPDSGCVYSVHPEMQELYGRIRAVRYPLDLATTDAAAAMQRLDQCDWFVLSGFDTAEPALPALYPWPALKGWTVPVLSSVFRHGPAEVPAGILLRRKTTPPESGETK